MGSSSSKQQYYRYPYTGQPVSAPYPYPVQDQGQFGYYIQQVGSEPSQVQAIPGYYYYPDDQRVRSRTSHKRHKSAPLPSSSPTFPPQPNEKSTAGAFSEQTAAPTSEPAPELVVESVPPAPAAPEAPAEGLAETPAKTPAADANPTNVPSSPPAAPSVPEPDQPILINPLPNFPNNTPYADPSRRPRRTQKTGSSGVPGYYAIPVASVAYKPQLRPQYRSPKAKEPILRPPRPHEELKREAARANSTNRGPFTRLRSFTMPSLSRITSKKASRSPVTPHSISYPYPFAGAHGSRGPIPTFPPVSPGLPVTSGPPIIVPLNSPLNPTSLHKILYKKKLYPTAAHLFEAHKFLKHKPELAERIRTSSENAAEMDAFSRAFERDGFVRSDWALVWRDKMDDVLYLKFVQHPDIRAELMATGYSPLLDGNEPRRPDAEGVNELGKALVRLRERLRREGAR